MSKVKEREHGVEPDRPTTIEDHELPPLETIERPSEFTPAPTPSMFIRWMGWLLGVLALVGGGGLIWWAVVNSSTNDVTDLDAIPTEVEAAYNAETRALLDSMVVPVQIDAREVTSP